MDCVCVCVLLLSLLLCVSFRVGMGKTKYLRAFEWGMVGATRLYQELQHCWVFHAQQFRLCIKNGPPPKGHPANLVQLWEPMESTWARFRHYTLSSPCSNELRPRRMILKIQHPYRPISFGY
jgi:hypothetical protein